MSFETGYCNSVPVVIGPLTLKANELASTLLISYETPPLPLIVTDAT